MILFFCINKKCSPYRLVVRTLLFHGNNTGSNPVKGIFKNGLKKKSIVKKDKKFHY